MRTAIMQETQFPLLALKQHQIFAEDPHEFDRILLRKILRDGDRLPVAAQQFPRRRSRTNARQHLIFFRCQHLSSFSKAGEKVSQRYLPRIGSRFQLARIIHSWRRSKGEISGAKTMGRYLVAAYKVSL